MEAESYIVYVQTDENGYITDVNSTAFVSSSWGTKIDEGTGDKFHHAQRHYFDGGLYTEDGIPRYKLVDGKPKERTETEIQADRPDPVPQAQAIRQEENKLALAEWLSSHPYTWTDGKQYGVEEQDQNEMALNLMQYQAATSASQKAPLEWHAQKEACRSFTLEEYMGLSLAISAYVYPYRRYQESIKQAIYTAKSVDEVNAIVIDYSTVKHEYTKK